MTVKIKIYKKNYHFNDEYWIISDSPGELHSYISVNRAGIMQRGHIEREELEKNFYASSRFNHLWAYSWAGGKERVINELVELDRQKQQLAVS